MEEEFVRDELDEWVADHMDEFVSNYRGNYLVIIGKEVIAATKDRAIAWKEAGKRIPEQIPYVLYIPKKTEENLLL